MTLTQAVVAAIAEPTPGLREFSLTPRTGATFTRFSPGSHLTLRLPGEPQLQNCYSLACRPWATGEYRIAVRRIDAGRGGSRRAHELATGDEVEFEPPRNLFPPPSLARCHLMVAGGIGVTPFVSWVEHFVRNGIAFELLAAGRGLDRTRLLAQLLELAPGSVRILASRSELLEQAAAALERRPLGTHLSVCGPTPMMDAVLTAARDRGWPEARLHQERFGVEPGAMEPFEVELRKQGGRVVVPAGTTLLEALEQSGIELPYSCRQGVCGECVTGVLGGTPDHRDVYLTAAERRSGQAMMPCVSRCAVDELLVLDL